MLVLALETSSPRGAIALFDGPACRRTLDLPPGPSQGRELLAGVAEVLRAAGAGPRDLGGVAVSVGPGSYTGCRVGVTAAKTLGFALGIPVVGLSTLEVIAAAEPAAEPVVAVLDARRGRFFAARFRVASAAQPERLDADRVGEPAALRSLLDPAALLCGTGASRWLEALVETPPRVAGAASSRCRRRAEILDLPRVEVVGRLGVARLLASRRPEGADGAGGPDGDGRLHALEPAYLQLSEPEIRRARQGGSTCP